MKQIYSLILAFSFCLCLTAQNRAIVNLRTNAEFSFSARVPIEDARPFLAYFIRWEGSNAQWRIRFLNGEQQWTDWQLLRRESHNPEIFITELQYTTSDQQAFQIEQVGGGYQDVELHFYNPGPTRRSEGEQIESTGIARACPCPLPNIELRDDWCPDGDCPKIANPVFTNVSHLIVHHSAGPNSATDWAARVRAIWDFHVMGNGWDDIGYNYLIDPNGVVYEGRGNDVRGAHFCGNNTGTMGVCVLGTFTSITPTAAAQASLVDLLTWKSCDRDFSPLGIAFHASSNKDLNRIVGHQDGCATECPGAAFYPLIPSIRDACFARIVTACSGLPGPLPLAATAVNGMEVALTWTDNTEGESGFLLERRLEGQGDFVVVADIAANMETYTDMVPAMDIYEYRLQAYTLIDSSAYSNVAEVSTIFSSVQDLADLLDIKISPNPSANTTVLELSGDIMGAIQLSLWTPEGKLLRQWLTQKDSYDWTQAVDLSPLANGTYLLRLAMEDRQSQLRLIKID